MRPRFQIQKIAMHFMLLWPTFSFAIPSQQPPLTNNQFQVGLVGSSYLGTNTEATAGQRKGNLGLTLAWKGVGNKNNFRSTLEADALYGLEKSSYRYVNLSEGFFGFDFYSEDLTSSVYVGRKKEIWNELDSYWTQGLFQPRFRWDYLNEKENGLFGLFGKIQSQTVKIIAFYSPLLIPEQGAPSEFIDGSCRTSSPWFNCPSSTLSLFNQPTPIYFKLQVPPTKQLITHQSLGASIRLGEATGPYVRGAYANKPMNQFLLAYEGYLDLSTLALPATIYPRQLRHELYSVDAGVIMNNSSIVGSMIWENPKRDATPSTWTTQETSDAFYIGAIYKINPFQGQYSKTHLEASILHREGGYTTDKGPFASASSSIFEPRQPFQNAIALSIQTPFLDRWTNFQYSQKFILDTANQGNILVTDIFYRAFKNGRINIGVDILGSKSNKAVDFISRYQRNDRVRGAFTYAF